MIADEADDLNAGTETEVDTDADGAEDTEGKAPEKTEAVASPEGDKGADTQDGKGGKPKTIATGADAEAEDKAKAEAETKAPPKSDWPSDWREKLAQHIAAGDKKRYDKELKRLQRITDPAGVYGMYREMEARFTSGDIIKKPGKDAKPEDIEAYHRALGVPEKPEDYLKDVKLENGATIGDADKPVLSTFAEAMHKAGAPPAVMNAALNWYYQRQEQMAAELDEEDDKFRRESEAELKEELGGAFNRSVRAIRELFATAEGGGDPENPNSVMARLMGGRTSDGKIIGNDPKIMRCFMGIARELNPIASVVEDGVASIKTIEQELAELQELRKTDKRKYYSEAVQARELELIAARDKARQRAA